MADASDSDESFISATVEDEVTIHIKKEIESCGDGLLLRDHCIYKVPITLRHLKPEAYTPKFVSIGPFHHGDERLQDMERHKQTMFKRFTQRATPNLSLDDLVGRIKLLEPEVRASYSETIKLSEDELLKLILMDAGFIIELLVICHKGEEKTDAKLSQPWLDGSIHKDLMLIENQLPFFVIEALFNQALPRDHRGSLPSFRRLVYDYFGDYNRQNIEPNRAVKIKHFTDIIRLFYLPKEMSEKMSDQQPFSEDESHSLLYNANALQEAGIKLKACKSKSKCLLDLKFSGSIFEIPQITVDDDTELLFRNMIAFEQCHYPYASYITDYALVLDFLIDTYKDVDLLIHKEIISHGLGDSSNVAELFNGLWKNVLQSNFNSQYLDICQKLNGYCHNPWHKKMATLRRDYCNTPWRTVATITGIILLVLTIVQTIFSVLQVVLK